MAACMSRHCLMLFAGAILALTFVHGLEAAEPSPDKQPCDKQDNDEPGTLCRATINCYCISGTYLDIPPNLCDTFDQDNIECSSYCKPCPDSTFSPFDNRCLACRPITPCKPNEEVIINATGRADQVCGCRRQDLTCPPCPEQTTPTFTSTQVETVVDPSVNPPPCPPKEQATDPQRTFGDWSCVIGFLVPICLVLFLIGILYVFLKKRGYRLRLPWKKVPKQSDDSEGKKVSIPTVDSKGKKVSIPTVDSKAGSSNSFKMSSVDNKSSSANGKASKRNSNSGEESEHLLKSGDLPKPLEGLSLCNQLKQYLPIFGMGIRLEVPKDGNCFFHALEDQLKRLGLPPRSAADLRKELVEYLCNLDRKHPISESFSATEETREKYLDELAKEGAWVKGQDVAGAAKMLECDLIVVKSTEVGFIVSINKGGTDEIPLHVLLGLVDQHYISLSARSDSIDQDPGEQSSPSSPSEWFDSVHDFQPASKSDSHPIS